MYKMIALPETFTNVAPEFTQIGGKKRRGKGKSTKKKAKKGKGTKKRRRRR